MRRPECEKCVALVRPTSSDNYAAARLKAIQWVKHFAERSDLINLGSTRTLIDFYDIKPEEVT